MFISVKNYTGIIKKYFVISHNELLKEISKKICEYFKLDIETIFYFEKNNISWRKSDNFGKFINGDYYFYFHKINGLICGNERMKQEYNLSHIDLFFSYKINKTLDTTFIGDMLTYNVVHSLKYYKKYNYMVCVKY